MKLQKQMINIIFQYIAIGLLLSIMSMNFLFPEDEIRWTLNWRNVPQDFREENAKIHCIAVSENGDIWAGSDNGVIHISGRYMQIYSSQAVHHISDIDVAPNGDVWILNEKNDLLRFDGYIWQQIPGERLSDITISPDGTVWGLTNGHLTKYKDGNWEPFEFPLIELDSFSDSLCATYATKDDSIWVSSCSHNNMILYQIKNDQILHSDPINIRGAAQKISVNNLDQIWVYSMGYKACSGVFGFSNNGEIIDIYDTFRFSNDFQQDYDFSVSNNNITWIASSNGLCRFNGHFCINYLKGEPVYSVATAPDGSVWLGLENQIVKLSR